MFSLNLLKNRFVRRRCEEQNSAVAKLHSPAEMQEFLVRERARVDRCGGELSLIAFSPRDWRSSRRTLVRLAETLKDRLRLTDYCGWLDDSRVGVLLPQTPATGAWRVIDDVMLRFGDDEKTPMCQVYSYPSEWWKGDDEDSHTLLDDKSYQPVHAMETLLDSSTPGWKRAIDVTGACVGLVILSPLMLGVAAAVKIGSPGPALFAQVRSGRNGRRFTMYKFRSMVSDAEARKQDLMVLNEQDGPAFKITDDPRITALGRFLRNTSIDELPQLWNVLKGDMSLVGPRPLPVHESEACAKWQLRRLDVTPGITCIWQCQGGRRVTFNEWMRMDLRYVKVRSLKADLSLIFRTIFAVISRKVLKHG